MNPNETWTGMDVTTNGEILIAAVQAGKGTNNPFMKLCAYSVPSDA
jgi:hypothetical protein